MVMLDRTKIAITVLLLELFLWESSVVHSFSSDIHSHVSAAFTSEHLEFACRQQRQSKAVVANAAASQQYPIVSSVTKPIHGATASRHWNQFTPKLWENERGIDVQLSWDPDLPMDSSQRMANWFLERMKEQTGKTVFHREELEHELATWIDCFLGYCKGSLSPSCWDGLTARIVSTRGAASTKCPRWHQDYIPFRWIQSLVGPGCQWIDPSSYKEQTINWEEDAAMEERLDLDLESTTEVNARRVDRASNAENNIRQARPGEGVLLIGKGWSQSSVLGLDRSLPPVIHKSPENIPPWQGRILLTMDVIQRK